jgi:putative ABC transport system permease protein
LGTSLAASQHERLRDAALLKVMGARRQQIARAFLLELAVIGLVSGIMAAIGASMIGWALARFVFEIHLEFSWWALVSGGVGGMIICVLAGWKMQRTVAKVSVIDILREL